MIKNTVHERIVQALTDRLLTCAVGDTVTKAEIAAFSDKQWILHSAKRRANEQSGMVFRTIYRIGIQRMADSEVPAAVGQQILKQVRTRTRRGARTISNTVTKSNSISDDGIILASATLSTFGLLNRQARLQHVEQKESEIRLSHTSTAEAAAASLEAMRKRRR